MSRPLPQTGHDLITMADSAVEISEALLAEAVVKVRERVTVEGHIVGRLFDREQRATHGLAWLATYVEAIRQLAAYAGRMHASARLGPIEELVTRIGLGEYLAQIFGGIPMSQGEIARLSDIGFVRAEIAERRTPFVEALMAGGNTAQRRGRLIELIRDERDTILGTTGLDDTVEAIRDEMRKFTISEVTQQAQRWHLSDSYIPLDIVAQMAELGVFGLTVPVEFSGMGMGKEAMCVVSEELSRGYIGVGSLGTRAELAAELVLNHGTDEQKQRWLPKIASGKVLPTAVLTEPNSGSDLASIRTRAISQGDVFKIRGHKTWITHAARADLMLLLVRTDPRETGNRGISILLAEKPRGTDERPFQVEGLTGSEIPSLGYRGMKQFELVFEGFEVPVSALLGGVEGIGFKQLMQSFETLRIQTAARAVGVAQSAMDQALGYATQRAQFGSPLIEFPRVADKIAMMAVEISVARHVTYFAARRKDSGVRCDLEAAMAKLLAARAAWIAADNAMQIHGGHGYAIEQPISRILCDARVLSIFEGSSEILAQLVARRLIGGAD